jgi:hypothetical protein
MIITKKNKMDDRGVKTHNGSLEKKSCHECEKEFALLRLRTCCECEKSYCGNCCDDAFYFDFGNIGVEGIKEDLPLCDGCWKTGWESPVMFKPAKK